MGNEIEQYEMTGEMPIQRFLTYRILRVHSKLNAQAIRILKEKSGLSLGHWRIMALVATNDGATHAQISRLSQIDKGQLSRNVKSMLAAGLLIARDDESDQRRQRLSLSPKGREIYAETLPRMRARQRYLLDHLSAAERDAVFSALDKLELAAEATEIPE